MAVVAAGTQMRGEPLAAVWAPIQSPSAWVQLASALVEFEAPMMATKI